MNEVYIPNIIIDLRSLHSNYGFKELYELPSKAFASKLDKLLDILKSISSIKVVGGEIEIRWKGRGALTLPAFFDGLNRRRMIIALDEAQRLRGPRSAEVLNGIVHAYDYDKNVTFILTGSEAGVLYGFLNIETPASPLYSRCCFRPNLERFGKSLSMKFLQLGFKEVGLDANAGIIEEAVEIFDGIPGWLTFFGNEYVRGLRSLERIKKLAVNLALEELRNILCERTKRYAVVLKGVAEGMNTWSKLKNYVKEMEGAIVSKSILYNIVRSLEGLNIIKNYGFSDPIYREASLRL